MHDDEDLLEQVLQIRLTNAEVLQRSPDEVGMVPVHGRYVVRGDTADFSELPWGGQNLLHTLWIPQRAGILHCKNTPAPKVASPPTAGCRQTGSKEPSIWKAW
jgi:hypothetical protein